MGAGPAVDPDTTDHASGATETLARLDACNDTWVTGERSLGTAGLATRCGELEGRFAEHPMAEPVLHISREAIHHGAEIALLRDLDLRR